MEKQSMVRRAANEFARGNYLIALDLYRRLSEQLGKGNFQANIWLCESRVRKQGRRDCNLLPLGDIKVACVMDEFTFHCFEPECNILPLTPEHAIGELEAFNPDLLFIESAWRGKDDRWNRKIGTLSQELRAVLQWCTERQVPRVFWNKEDPIHFETFLSTAQQFDFVFTTDIDCIARYKAALGHERIYLLPFACQPKTHNPVELYSRKDAFCFAGAYYVRYPERTRDLKNYVAEIPRYKPLEIFDRNFGKDDINYQFPAEYQPFIVGTLPFHEIDKAYKGYRYSINLNSIKQSQTMFARRVFELLGSNTITVSNFSRGLRLMFGDLVISSDSGSEIVDRLQRMDDEAEQKLRLAGLRKVMLEHTYGHRLGYVALKVFGRPLDNRLPTIVCIAMAGSEDEYCRVLDSYRNQRHSHRRLLVVLKGGLNADDVTLSESKDISIVAADSVGEWPIGRFWENEDWVAVLAAEDYYGPNYLLDLALAARYSDAQVIGKATRYHWDGENLNLLGPGQAYHIVSSFSARCSAIRGDLLPCDQVSVPWLERLLGDDWPLPGLAIDPFNYCLNGRNAPDLTPVRNGVDDLPVDAGLAVDELMRAAESIEPANYDDAALPKWNAARLLQLFGKISHRQITIEAQQDGLCIRSHLPDGKHDYLYCREALPISVFPIGNTLETHLEATPGLDVQYAFIFLDDKKQKLGHAIHTANRNHSATVPAQASFIRFGWRICGTGASTIKCLRWGHRKLEPARLIARSDTLLLINHYPNYDDLYRNGFVHSRVIAYRQRGVSIDIFRLRPGGVTSYHEFQNVDVVTAGENALRKALDSGHYKRVLVHFLSREMWNVLERYPTLPCLAWVHGAEIHSWHRREHNYQNEGEREKARRESERRLAFWRGILHPTAPNLRLIFVSRCFADQVFEDLGFRLPDDKYAIIHNPIDTELFFYQPKPPEQRRRVLSIRPYASRTYANDLSVKAILLLSEMPCFKDLEFRLVGDGKLFDEILEPLRNFSNVTIEKGFLSQRQIAALHKDYGVFLVPSRMDSQGVSRDEAMASGLVPVTNRIAAIPEFVDESCGLLAPPEDAAALAHAIVRLYESPILFEQLSKAAAQRVRAQSAAKRVVEQELALIRAAVADLEDSRSPNPTFLDAEVATPQRGDSLLSVHAAERKADFFRHAVDRTKKERPVSFISFDVEALPGRAEKDPVDRLIWGRFDGGEYGIPRICRILNQHGIKGNFLIDFAACLLYGDRAVREVVQFLLLQDHEVHVHLHSEWVVRKWMLGCKEWVGGPVAMDMLDEELNLSVLKYAVFKYRSLVERDPLVFRAGGYRFNAETVDAARQLGFKACSNFNSSRHAAAWSSKEPAILNNEPFRWQNGLIELPVDFSPEPLTHDWEKYQGIFDRAMSRKRVKTFNLTLHSWSLLTRGTGKRFLGFSAAHEERLHQICEHLKEQTQPMGYSEYLSLDIDLPKTADCRCLLFPPSITEHTTHCNICGATYGKPLINDICPSCESRARHRQILDVLSTIGNLFDGQSVLACHANPVEKQAFLSRASRVLNFDVRPLGYADLQMDIQSMDKIDDGSFDAFLAIHVLNHVADDRRALQEIYRVLKPGGLALITVPCRDNSATECCENVTEHYGADALSEFGVGTYRRYGLDDALKLFAKYFVVRQYKGLDEITASSDYVFILKKYVHRADLAASAFLNIQQCQIDEDFMMEKVTPC